MNRNPEQEILWNKINSFEPDHPDDSMTFSDRLARENGWQLEYALRTIDEYKKFMFLVCIAGHPLTPSDQVDQVWHLHLLYTYSYWKEFCRDVLGKEIHHGPTKGGENELARFTDLYEKTKVLYREKFGYPAPIDIWPTVEIRFSVNNFRRVNLDRNWIIGKPSIFKR